MSVPQSLTDSITHLSAAVNALVAELQKERANTAGGVLASDVPGVIAAIEAAVQAIDAALTPS